VGFLFIFSVGLGYFVLGAILRTILQWTTPSRSIVSPLIIIYGLVLVTYGVIKQLKKTNRITEFVCREDTGTLCRVVKTLKLSKITGFSQFFKYVYLVVLGLILSFTILPCSAGLYIVYNIILTDTSIYLWIPLTFLYILVFVSPLVLITLVLTGLVKTTKYLRSWSMSDKYTDLAKIIGGILAITTGIYLVYSS